MNIDLTLKYLQNQLKRIDIDLPEEWIQTTAGYAEDYFGSNHQRVHLLKQLRYTIVKQDLFEKDEAEIKEVKRKATQYVNEFIDDLEDLKKGQKTQSIIKYPLGLSQELFWTLLIALISGAFALGIYFGANKFDRNLIELSDANKELKDTIKVRENTIINIRHNSDSALNILGHMPYNEMKLDTLSFRKVQTTIENAGAALYLNK